MDFSTVIRAAVVAALAGAITAPAHAQLTPRTEFQNSRYLSFGPAANAPQVLLGVGAAFTQPRGFGLFADFKMSDRSPARASSFQPHWTMDQVLNEFGDQRVRDRDIWTSVNAGLTRVVGDELALYAGAGYVRRRAFSEFADTEGERGEFGFYWVEDTDLSGPLLNVLGGVLLRLNERVIARLGVESTPPGMTLGIHYAMPTRLR